MRDKRDRTVVSIGNRLALLRREKGLTQGEFAKEFSDFCNFEKCLLIPSVSSWEQNHRIPTIPTIILLAQYYGVTLDYLFGASDDKYGNGDIQNVSGSETRELIKHSDVPIKKKDFIKYNGMPVYVRFKDNQHLSQWGILNCNTNRIICKDFIVSLSVDVECYSYAPPSLVRTRLTSYQQLMDTDYIWVEMKTADNEVRSMYNGRYVHNEDKTALVKMDNGLVVKYQGFETVYWAFRA